MRWLAATTSVEIERPIDDVWAFVTDIGNMPHWVDGVSEAVLTPGRMLRRHPWRSGRRS